jgi:hypothetical protein
MVRLPPSHGDAPHSDVGHFHVGIEVANRAGGRFEPLQPTIVLFAAGTA